MTTPATLAAIADAFESDAGASTSANSTPAGYWKRISAAAETMAGAASSANASELGYMLRSAVAVDIRCGTDGSTTFNHGEEGYVARMVSAFETFDNTTYIGSRFYRLLQAITNFNQSSGLFLLQDGSSFLLLQSGDKLELQ